MWSVAKKSIIVDMKIYEQIIIDHFHNPRNKGTLVNPDFATQEYIPSCGDRIALQGTITENKLSTIRFTGAGCVISQAAASLLTEYALGKSIEELLALDKNHMLSMLGMQLGPTRLQCALLALHALQEGIRGYTKSSGGNDDAQSAETRPKIVRNQ